MRIGNFFDTNLQCPKENIQRNQESKTIDTNTCLSDTNINTSVLARKT